MRLLTLQDVLHDAVSVWSALSPSALCHSWGVLRGTLIPHTVAAILRGTLTSQLCKTLLQALEPYIFPYTTSLRYRGPSGSHTSHNLHWPASNYYLQTEGTRKDDCAKWWQHLSHTEISDTMQLVTPATIWSNCTNTSQFHYANFKLEMFSADNNQDL